MKKIILVALLIHIMVLLYSVPDADTIAQNHFNLKKTGDSFSITTMILINKNEEKTVNKMESYSKQGKDGKNTFIKFIEPAHIKNTTFLTLGHRDGDDEQRMYLPAFGKIRKISPSNKGRKFMGSDLFYYDMEDHTYNDFDYKFLKEDQYDGKDCYVIEMFPKDKNAPYSKQVSWICKTNYFSYKIECYDKKNEANKTKTIVFREVKDFSGVLIALKILIDNHIDDHKTFLQENNMKINVGLKDDIFSIQNMQK